MQGSRVHHELPSVFAATVGQPGPKDILSPCYPESPFRWTNETRNAFTLSFYRNPQSLPIHLELPLARSDGKFFDLLLQSSHTTKAPDNHILPTQAHPFSPSLFGPTTSALWILASQSPNNTLTMALLETITEVSSTPDSWERDSWEVDDRDLSPVSRYRTPDTAHNSSPSISSKSYRSYHGSSDLSPHPSRSYHTLPLSVNPSSVHTRDRETPSPSTPDPIIQLGSDEKHVIMSLWGVQEYVNATTETH